MRYLVAVVVWLAASLSFAQTLKPCGGLLASGDEALGGGYSGQQQFNQIQQWSGWGSCDNATQPPYQYSCSGGLATGTCWIERYQKFPSLTGDSTEIYDYGVSGQQGDNALFWKKLAPSSDETMFNGVTSVMFYYSFKVDSHASTNARTLEFDIFQFYQPTSGSNQTFMMGTQCDLYPSGLQGQQVWELWNQAGGAWTHSYTIQNHQGLLGCDRLLDGTGTTLSFTLRSSSLRTPTPFKRSQLTGRRIHSPVATRFQHPQPVSRQILESSSSLMFTQAAPGGFMNGSMT